MHKACQTIQWCQESCWSNYSNQSLNCLQNFQDFSDFKFKAISCNFHTSLLNKFLAVFNSIDLVFKGKRNIHQWILSLQTKHSKDYPYTSLFGYVQFHPIWGKQDLQRLTCYDSNQKCVKDFETHFKVRVRGQNKTIKERSFLSNGALWYSDHDLKEYSQKVIEESLLNLHLKEFSHFKIFWNWSKCKSYQFPHE